MPDAISGTEFRQLLKKKETEKETAALEKERKKQDRELKRKIKMEELLTKKKKQKKQGKQAQKKVCRTTRKGKLDRTAIDDETPEPSDIDVQYAESDDMSDVDNDLCIKCDGAFEKQARNWISCSKCSRRFHESCVAQMDIVYDNIEHELKDTFLFECDYC